LHLKHHSRFDCARYSRFWTLYPYLHTTVFGEASSVIAWCPSSCLFCVGLQDKDIGTVKVSLCLIPSKSKVLGILINISHSCSLIYLMTGRPWDRKGIGSIKLHQDDEVVWLPSLHCRKTNRSNLTSTERGSQICLVSLYKFQFIKQCMLPSALL
jgi:hypothetical protein